MKTFEVEVIHELSGAYMDFEIEVDDDVTEDDIWKIVLEDISVVANEVK